MYVYQRYVYVVFDIYSRLSHFHFFHSPSIQYTQLHKAGLEPSSTDQKSQLLRSSQSHEELRDVRLHPDIRITTPERGKRESKTVGLFRRLKKKKAATSSRANNPAAVSNTREGVELTVERIPSSVSSVESSSPSHLTSSMSMPDIARELGSREICP